MENNNKLISVGNLIMAIRDDAFIDGRTFARVKDHIEASVAVNAVEVSRIEEVKQEILQRMDEFIEGYRRLSSCSHNYYGGLAESMETARRLVNAALTDLCSGENDNG